MSSLMSQDVQSAASTFAAATAPEKTNEAVGVPVMVTVALPPSARSPSVQVPAPLALSMLQVPAVVVADHVTSEGTVNVRATPVAVTVPPLLMATFKVRSPLSKVEVVATVRAAFCKQGERAAARTTH